MPGICGALSVTPRSDPDGLVAEMVRRMKHHPWYVEQQHATAAGDLTLGQVTLGHGNAVPQSGSNEDGSLLAVMEGELHNYDEERRRLEAAGHVFHSDSPAELLAHGFEQEGKAFFRRLNGLFAVALWDAGRRRLYLANDRFGIKALYYSQAAGKLLFASEVKALLADRHLPRAVDPRGAAQFFTYGHLFGEDTLHQGVRLLPAAGWLTYDAAEDRLTVERYWRFEPGAVAAPASEPEQLDRLADAFRRAVARRTGGDERLGLSLSGGLDARTILGVVAADRELTSVTLGIPGSIDHCVAAELARVAGRPHRNFVLDEQFLSRFEDHLRWMVHLTDGHYLSQCIVMPTLPVYRDLGIQVLLRGHAGELMHLDKAYNFSLDSEGLALRDSTALESWLWRRLQTYMLDELREPLFAPGFHCDAAELARASLRDCLAETDEVTPPAQRVSHLFLAQRVRRETALSMLEFGSLVSIRLPYLDNDLVDALLAAPAALKWGDRIQAHILRRHQPAFLRVVNTNTGARMGAGPLARFAAKVRLKVLAKLGVAGYQPYERLGLWLRQELRPLVERLLLDPRCLDRGVFNPSAVQAVVRRHLAGQANHTYLLMAMLIFEQGQREFVDDERVGAGAADPVGVPVALNGPG